MPEYTLTGATDWPMLLTVAKLTAWIVGGLLGLNATLIAAMWWDFRQQFAGHKTCEQAKCTRCREDISNEHKAIWETLDICCPREAGSRGN